MKFNLHKNLAGCHAPFTASKSSWLRYDDEKVIETYNNLKSAERGTRLHEWAKDTIDLGIKMPKNGSTLNAYVNDAIGFRMSTEVVLFYSERFFGTADAISFSRNVLRIHDLKTGKVGKIESHFEQLEVYAALFCLEYKVRPGDIRFELRVYKSDEVACHKPNADAIAHVMDTIVRFNKLLEKLDSEEEFTP